MHGGAPGGPASVARLAAGLLAAALLTGVAGVPAGARAESPPPAPVPVAVVRTGEHPGFGRVVVDVPAGANWTLERNGDRLAVRLNGARPDGAPPAPRNVRALTAAPGRLDLVLAPGVDYRSTRMGNRLVLDLLDPGPAPAGSSPRAGAAAEPASARPAPRPGTRAAKAGPAKMAPPLPPTPPPAPVLAQATPGTVVTTFQAAIAGAAQHGMTAELPHVQTAPRQPVAPPAPPAPTAPAASPATAAGSSSPGAGPVTLAASSNASSGMLLPFAPTTGAAAFRRGDEAVLVFDERRPIDVAALHSDPLFGEAEVRLLPAATLVRLKLPEGQALQLTRQPGGWLVKTTADAALLEPIHSQVDANAPAGTRLRLPVNAVGHAVSVPDPLTGGTLLVGTQRKPGQALMVMQRAPEFALLPTWQGIVVAMVADNLTLREADDAFLLTAGAPAGGLALASADYDSAALADAASLTRRFDLPPLPVPALLRRLQTALRDTVAQPAGRRTRPRLACAEAMLALGMGTEAQSVLTMAFSADPHAGDDPTGAGLAAIAALLAGRTGESGGLEDSRLSGSDEIALWRALRQATLQEGSPQAAAVLSSEYRLLLAYPLPLQTRLLPLAAETMALGGETAAAQRLVDARPKDASLDYARALLAEKKKDPEAALTILDRLARSPDRLERARAAPRAVELRLASQQITPAAAAEALDKLVYAWRGDQREADLRLRAAELRAQAGQPRAALALLREGAEALPDAAEAMRTRMRTVFAASLANDPAHPMAPLDLVSLVDENPDLLPDGEAGMALAGQLADRLAALDLPQRAAPVLEKLAAGSAAGPVQAALGNRLAMARLQMGDATGALSALAGTQAPELPAPLTEERVLTWAQATAAQGDPARAAAVLAGLDSSAAMELRGQLLEKAGDWKGATAVLRRYAELTLPGQGTLDDQQGGVVLRLATAAAQADDEATLAELRGRALPRLPAGQNADMLRLLTESPVRSPADLPRARREAALAEQILRGTAR